MRALCFFTFFAVGLLQAQTAEKRVVPPVQVTSPLPSGTVPMDVEVDFSAVLRKAGLPGVLDPNSVEVVNLTSSTRTPHALSPHVAYGHRARVRWLAANPAETRFEIRFATAPQRPRDDTPLIGVGDMLCYTGPQPQAMGGCLATRLIDMNGDGVRDLLVTDYYTTEPLWPERIPDSWSPFICYPGVKDGEKLLFGNGVRLRYREKPDAPSQFFIGGYMHADVGDVNGDGLPDFAFAAMEKSSEASKVPDVAEFIHIYLNSGKLDEGGMPVFVYTDRVKHPKGNWGPVRIVDMDRDRPLSRCRRHGWRRSARPHRQHRGGQLRFLSTHRHGHGQAPGGGVRRGAGRAPLTSHLEPALLMNSPLPLLGLMPPSKRSLQKVGLVCGPSVQKYCCHSWLQPSVPRFPSRRQTHPRIPDEHPPHAQRMLCLRRAGGSQEFSRWWRERSDREPPDNATQARPTDRRSRSGRSARSVHLPNASAEETMRWSWACKRPTHTRPERAAESAQGQPSLSEATLGPRRHPIGKQTQHAAAHRARQQRLCRPIAADRSSRRIGKFGWLRQLGLVLSAVLMPWEEAHLAVMNEPSQQPP